MIRTGEQQTTREWWNTQRTRFELLTSQVVIIECGADDPVAAADRLKALEGLSLVSVTDVATRLASELVRQHVF